MGKESWVERFKCQYADTSLDSPLSPCQVLGKCINAGALGQEISYALLGLPSTSKQTHWDEVSHFAQRLTCCHPDLLVVKEELWQMIDEQRVL